MTKKQIEKTAQAHGISITLVEIKRTSGTYAFDMKELPAELVKKNLAHYYETGEELPEIGRAIRKYNSQVKKLLKVLGLKYWGVRYGSGKWHYELGAMNYSTKLALANID